MRESNRAPSLETQMCSCMSVTPISVTRIVPSTVLIVDAWSIGTVYHDGATLLLCHNWPGQQVLAVAQRASRSTRIDLHESVTFTTAR